MILNVLGKIIKDLEKKGLFKNLPFEPALGSAVMEKVVTLEEKLGLKPQRGTRILSAYNGNKETICRDTVINNLQIMTEWQKETETRENKLKNMFRKQKEKDQILKIVEDIDQEPDNATLFELYKTNWCNMKAQDQLTCLLLSETVYQILTDSSDEVNLEKLVVKEYFNDIKARSDGASLFNAP